MSSTMPIESFQLIYTGSEVRSGAMDVYDLLLHLLQSVI